MDLADFLDAMMNVIIRYHDLTCNENKNSQDCPTPMARLHALKNKTLDEITIELNELINAPQINEERRTLFAYLLYNIQVLKPFVDNPGDTSTITKETRAADVHRQLSDLLLNVRNLLCTPWDGRALYSTEARRGIRVKYSNMEVILPHITWLGYIGKAGRFLQEELLDPLHLTANSDAFAIESAIQPMINIYVQKAYSEENLSLKMQLCRGQEELEALRKALIEQEATQIEQNNIIIQLTARLAVAEKKLGEKEREIIEVKQQLEAQITTPQENRPVDQQLPAAETPVGNKALQAPSIGLRRGSFMRTPSFLQHPTLFSFTHFQNTYSKHPSLQASGEDIITTQPT